MSEPRASLGPGSSTSVTGTACPRLLAAPRGGSDPVLLAGVPGAAAVPPGVAPEEADGTGRAVGGQPGPRWDCCPQPSPALSHQATELLDAILEGYPKSKKQFFVSTEAGLCPTAAEPDPKPVLICSVPCRRRLG